MSPLLVALATLAALAGCAATTPVAPTAVAAAPAVGPAARIADDVVAVRRCIDNQLLDSGQHDLSLVVDQVADPSRPADATARDLLTSVLAGMTPRSRAVRVVSPGADSAGAVPRFAMRGSVRFDGGGGDALGLDLAVLSARDLSVVPGTASHSVARWTAPAAGAAGRVELRKLGTRYSLQASTQTEALRALLELGAAETLGRLARVPYWSCFGASVDDAAVAGEIQDWYDALAARPAEIIAFFQDRLRQRGAYDGPVDGIVNPALKESVARYREALGLTREAKLSLDFFRAYLGADHASVAQRLAPAAPSSAPVASAAPVPAAAPLPVPSPVPSPVPVPVPAAEPAAATAALGLRVATRSDPRRMQPGETVRLSIRPTRDAHVYCFHQDEDGHITRFFPNRFQSDSRVPAATGLQLPGPMRFEIAMNRRGAPEAISCFATERDVLDRLPDGVNGTDFATLPVASLEQVQQAFRTVAGGPLGHESLQLRAR
jgi:hypothetical protein